MTGSFKSTGYVVKELLSELLICMRVSINQESTGIGKERVSHEKKINYFISHSSTDNGKCIYAGYV